MGDNNRKRKQHWNTHVKQKSVEPGLSGIFFTCDGHEKQALAEAYNLIDELMESVPGVSEETVKEKTEESESDEDIADTLKRQCNETREVTAKKERRCIQRPTGVKNCLFVTVKGADAVSLCDRMITLTQKSARCRYLQRALPVEETAVVGLKEMEEVVLKLIQRHMVANSEGKLPTYALEFKARNNSQIKKQNVLDMMNDAVGMIAPSARVDLNGAEVTFFIQVVKKSIMAGAAKNYFNRRKYSMRPKEEKNAEEEKTEDNEE